jgi:hypothetical protein
MTHLVPVLRPVLGSPFRRAGLYRAAGEIPSWHIAPVRTGTVTDLIAGSQIITFTNSSPAWGFNSSGTLVQPAANVPFIEYDPATGSALGWRIWDAVVNGHIYSEDISQWLTPTNITTALNQTTAPTGSTTADRYLETSATGLHVQAGSAISFVAGTQYTYSCFVKPISRNYEIGFPPIFGTSRFARFNTTTGVVQGTDTGVGALIIPCRDGWYRCFSSSTCATSASGRVDNFINDDSFSRNYAGDTSKGLFIFGAQINVGPLAPYPYVPATGALTTSSTADVASITGAAFAGIWNQPAGTLYASVIMAQPTKSGNQFIIRASDNGYNNTVNLNVQSGFPSISTSAGGVFDGTATSAQSLTTAAANFAGAYAANDLALAYANATVTDSTATMPLNLTRIDFGADHNGLNRATGVYIRELAIWKSRRPNANLQAMTQ